MKENYITIRQNDGYSISLFYYQTLHTPVLGSILLLHGMAEHHGRYREFISFLNQEGFDVYTYDHRGHGTDKKLTDLGYFANKNGDRLVVSDAITICHYIKENGRTDKFAVFGHSMGSLILRCVMQQYDAMDCALVCATTMPPIAVSNLGIFLAELLCLFRGVKERSPFLNKMMFGGKAYTRLCTRTTFDWLTRNNTQVGIYIDDPFCGFLCTTSFYRDLLKLAKRAAVKRYISKTRKNLPVHFFAGSKDPVGGYGVQIKKLHKIYTTLGFTKTAVTIYPEARHELLNELNAEEFMQDALAFFRANMK